MDSTTHFKAPIDDIVLFNELLRQVSSFLWSADDDEIPETFRSEVGRENAFHIHLAILCHLKEGLDNARVQHKFLKLIVAYEGGIFLDRNAPFVEAILQSDL